LLTSRASSGAARRRCTLSFVRRCEETVDGQADLSQSGHGALTTSRLRLRHSAVARFGRLTECPTSETPSDRFCKQLARSPAPHHPLRRDVAVGRRAPGSGRVLCGPLPSFARPQPARSAPSMMSGVDGRGRERPPGSAIRLVRIDGWW
jgi:hypothetical protein